MIVMYFPCHNKTNYKESPQHARKKNTGKILTRCLGLITLIQKDVANRQNRPGPTIGIIILTIKMCIQNHICYGTVNSIKKF